MKLIIVRHAKSSWESAAASDHDRPLAPRGERAALTIGNWLAERGHAPASVICSSALRTRQTWEIMQPCFPEPPDVRFEPALYHAGSARMADMLRGAVDTPVMLIGHNPGIGAFAREILEMHPAHADFARYPTAAATVCGFSGSNWRDIRPGSGRLIAFTVPRDHG